MGHIRGCPRGDRRLQRDAWGSAPLVDRESVQKGSGRSAIVCSAPQGAWHLRRNLLSRGSIRLFLSKPMEPQSPTHACVMSDVSREDDVRSLAGSHLSSSRSHERSGVWLTRPHLGIRMVVFSWTKIKSGPLSESRWQRIGAIIGHTYDGLRNIGKRRKCPRFASADSRGGCPYAGGVDSERISSARSVRKTRLPGTFLARAIEPASGEPFRRSCRIRGRWRSRRNLCSCRSASGPAMRSGRGKPAEPL